MIYTGIRILDLSRVFAGPFCTRQFADLGAEVIKIESPLHPDPAKQLPPMVGEVSGYYEICNRNKSSLPLNLKLKEDQEKFYQLVATADVVVENFSPQVKHKLNISYDTLKTYKPDIIYASISGYGHTINKKAFDVVIQGACGLANLNGYGDTPMKNATAVVDTYTGLNAAFAISNALYHRTQTGEGQFLDISMLGSGLQLLENNIIQTSLTTTERTRSGNQDNVIAPFGLYKAKDGYVTLAICSDIQRANFCLDILDIDTIYPGAEARLTASEHITIFIEDNFADRSRQDIVNLLDEIGIAGGPVLTTMEIIADASLYESGYLHKIHHPVLGECVVPYMSVAYGGIETPSYKSAPV